MIWGINIMTSMWKFKVDVIEVQLEVGGRSYTRQFVGYVSPTLYKGIFSVNPAKSEVVFELKSDWVAIDNEKNKHERSAHVVRWEVVNILPSIWVDSKNGVIPEDQLGLYTEWTPETVQDQLMEDYLNSGETDQRMQ